VDRINVDKVERFLATLAESVRGNEPELLKKIAGGDWSDETQSELEKVVSQYAEDFGYDLDEEGHPLDDDDPAPSGRSDRGGDSGESAGSDQDDGDSETHSEESREKAAAA
jgi:F-type H+-transporting ATPase subunit alpha